MGARLPATDPLAALRANYSRSLPSKLAKIDESVAALDGGPAAVQAVRDLVHKLAGSAPTFGFPELGDAARIAERACDAALGVGQAAEEAVDAIRDAVAAMNEVAAKWRAPRAAEGVASRPFLAGRVLVVEDEPSQALFAQVVLRKGGLDVVIEADPARVADRLAEIDPDVVFLDMNLPGMTGEDVARRIRARGDARASVPIVFLSGEEDPARRDAAMAAGADGFIAKPVDPVTLIDTARRFVTKRSGEKSE